MATKKPEPKKVATKPSSKKEAKPVAKASVKKPVAKPAPKKAIAEKKVVAEKPKAKKPVEKPTAKKAVSKPVDKKAKAKATAKPEVKKAKIVKPVAKVPAAKPVDKKALAKSEPKKAEKKTTAKVVKEKVDKIKTEKKETKKEVIEKPSIAKSAAKSAKKTPTKTLISSTNMLPKKSDVYKTNTFAANTLKNDSGKVIAHRKTSELKRKTNDEGDIKKYEPEFTRSILDMSTTNDGPSYRYSDDDLGEFKDIIIKKLETAKAELQYLQGVIMRKDEGGTEDTENKYQNIEDGGASMEREQFNQLASRQITFIGHLEQALVRIENKTYGICRETGKLIDKARLRAVPHATLSIEAKNAKKN
ncbi:MAG TPA: TraR/DksA C4-type zinc finger protein [Chitinophagaceae bacterium]|jgi:RNA polymerase-binding transcription factor DksA|nr:TraR/DksA C4-type zinc finger protein [Chitinophagaceae bacterium]